MSLHWLRSGITRWIWLLILALSACGGGTSGSGLKTFDGKVMSSDGQPLSGVVVSIESSNETAVTDTDGVFSLTSSASGEQVDFRIESAEFSTGFSLAAVSDDNARIALAITVDTVADTLEVDHVRLRAWFAGVCDLYFENSAVIRQANRVPRGTVCSLNVEVLGAGHRLGGIPVALQYSRCEEGSTWETLTVVRTDTGVHQGAAELNFVYTSSPEFCRYRVVAPAGAGGDGPVSYYPIDTFAEQAFFRK